MIVERWYGGGGGGVNIRRLIREGQVEEEQWKNQEGMASGMGTLMKSEKE